MIIKFDKKITEKNTSIFDYIEAKGMWYPVYFIIDSKLRKSANLKEWLAEQLTYPSAEIMRLAEELKDKEYDYTVTNVLRWVNEHIKYVPDQEVWSMPDKWQTAEETLARGTGDCEDMHVLSYVLNYLAGVPTNRMLLFCGDVAGGGHCWLGYKSQEYPLNWCFMDACYWYDRMSPSSRTKYYIEDTIIYDDPKKQYLKIWFAFNSNNSYKGIANNHNPA